ncbi:MAG: glycosyltransferase family 4 protein [Bacteroidetes bacterium]|nr:glycosyltransferase family 4 protein [Bacteroidota bacterium]
MRVLISITNLETGGAQMFVLHLASALAEKHTVYLYDQRPEDRNHQFVKNNVSKKVNIISYTSNRLLLKVIWKIKRTIDQVGFNFNLRDWLNELYFKNVIKKYKIEVVHSHLALSDYIVCKTLKAVKMPLVITVHGCYDIDKTSENNPYNITAVNNIPALVKKVNAIVYLTDKNLFSFKPYIQNEKILTKKIYNGFNFIGSPIQKSDVRKKYKIDENDFIFVMAARGYKEKGWKEAIKSFINIQGKSLNTYLFLLGDSPYIQELKLRYKHIKNIFFWGNIASPLEILSICNIGLLPSYRECLPNAIVEYLYCGLPVIATKTGEIESMITYNNNKAGILINLLQNGQPDINEITEAMLYYINNPEARKEQNEIAKNAAKKFNMTKCIEAYTSLYNELLSVTAQ